MSKNYAEKDDWKTFSHNVGWLQKKHGLTNKKMAETLDISTTTLNKIKKGEFPPRLSVDVFFYIAHTFKIKPSDQLQIWLED